jgi:penicillin-binding protein 1A
MWLIKLTHEIPNSVDLLNYNPNSTTKIYSLDGKLINSFSVENRTIVPLNKIPLKLRQALISAEDRTFYTNKGIDFPMILRAIVYNTYNLMTLQGELVGASTITQQVVKNLILTNERTLTRKIKEAVISYKITQKMSKDDILEI